MRRWFVGLWVGVLVSFSGCYPDEFPRDNPADPGGSAYVADEDEDGFGADEDCNDADAAIYPGATELCDGLDNDCLNGIDDGLPTTAYYQDKDRDGYGAGTSSSHCGDALPGEVTADGDCDDNDDDISPEAKEVCNEEDDDCDGKTDEGLPTDTFYQDKDEDGFGNDKVVSEHCDLGNSDETTTPGDCDDGNPDINPEASEVCNGEDDDCDELSDYGTEELQYQDLDRDNWGSEGRTVTSCYPLTGYSLTPGDCNDANAQIHPYASESCNGIDDDCDEEIDEGFSTVWYVDADEDGFGSLEDGGEVSCLSISGKVQNNLDCDDGASETNPNANEVCDGQDNNCDGTVDEGVSTQLWPDKDGDGYGRSSSQPTTACEGMAGYVANGDDCNDADSSIHPGVSDPCDEADNDCDGELDEDQPASIWYIDMDMDGYGDSSSAGTSRCFPSDIESANNLDCNDSDPEISPGAAERCNGLDDNCDGQGDDILDENGDGGLDCDEDGDGVTPFHPVPDCDDTIASIYPGALEIYDWVDNDCDDRIDQDILLLKQEYAEKTGNGVGHGLVLDSLDEFTGTDVLTLTNQGSPGPAILLNLGGTASSNLNQMASFPGVDGITAAVAGDANFDGISDLYLSTDVDKGVGSVLLYLAPNNMFNGDYSVADAAASISGDSQGDRFGASLLLQDMDDDGTPELVVGSPGFKESRGRVVIFSIYIDELTNSLIIKWRGSLIGTDPGDELGASLAGSVSRDQLWIGAPGANGGAGRVYLMRKLAYLLSGVDLDIIDTFYASYASSVRGMVRLGDLMEITSDLDGSGKEETVVAGTSTDGETTLYFLGQEQTTYGGEQDLERVADIYRTALESGFYVSDLSPLPDITGDGRPELLIGGLNTLSQPGAQVFLLNSGAIVPKGVLEDEAAASFLGPAPVFSDMVTVGGGYLDGSRRLHLVVGVAGFSADGSSWDGQVLATPLNTHL